MANKGQGVDNGLSGSRRAKRGDVPAGPVMAELLLRRLLPPSRFKKFLSHVDIYATTV